MMQVLPIMSDFKLEKLEAVLPGNVTIIIIIVKIIVIKMMMMIINNIACKFMMTSRHSATEGLGRKRKKTRMP